MGSARAAEYHSTGSQAVYNARCDAGLYSIVLKNANQPRAALLCSGLQVTFQKAVLLLGDTALETVNIPLHT